MALGSAHKVAHTLENRYKTNTVKANSLIMNYVAYMRVHILTKKKKTYLNVWFKNKIIFKSI